MIRYYMILLLVCILVAIAQTILKSLAIEYSGNFFKSLFDPLIYLCISLLVLALLLWFIPASRIEASILMPVSILTVVFSTILGVFIFNEEINFRKIIAYALIIVGLIALIHSQNFQENNLSEKNKFLNL